MTIFAWPRGNRARGLDDSGGAHAGEPDWVLPGFRPWCRVSVLPGRPRSGLGAVGAGHAQEDDQHDEQYGDCSWCYRAGPVEAWGRGNRDRQALAGQHVPEELALLKGGAAGEGVRCGDGGEADGGQGRADGDPGGEDAMGSFQGGGACRGGAIG